MSPHDRSARQGINPTVVAPPRPVGRWETALTHLAVQHRVGAVAIGTAVAVVAALGIAATSIALATGWSSEVSRTHVLLLATFIPMAVAPPLFGSAFAVVRSLDRTRAALRTAAETDPLTNVLNRRGFFERFDGDCPPDACVHMIDLDDFKVLNDTHGHDLGDRVLIDVARWLEARLGDDVVVGRLGGDEFACISTTFDDTLANARHGFEVDGVGYSISIGTTRTSWNEGLSEALMRADSALYRTKRSASAPQHQHQQR